jgi:hypothetical protein
VTPPLERSVLVLTDQALAVRARLEPTAWIVLEELAVQATHVDGQAVAEQSARSIAESVGRSKDAVARALRTLLAEELIERGESRHGFSGRFAGMHYVVDLRAAGLRLPAEPITATASAPAAAPHQPPELLPPPSAAPAPNVVPGEPRTTRLF